MLPEKNGKYFPKDILKAIFSELHPLKKEARLEAEIVLEVILKLDAVKIHLNEPVHISKAKLKKINHLISRRKNHYPLQYLLGNVNFMGHKIRVSPDVLVPRQETEILAGTCLDLLSGSSGELLGLDLGTGSGNIPIALVKKNPRLKMVAVDISRPALKVARRNAREMGSAGRIKFLSGDLFAPLKSYRGKFDFIISNPPYIPAGQLARLQPEVRFEPQKALDGGADGLDIIRKITSAAGRYLKPDGFLVFEIGAGQGTAIGRLINAGKIFSKHEVFNDYSGWERVVLCEHLIPEEKKIKSATTVLKKGGVVVFPTATVYGLGADSQNEKAVRKIYSLKGRPDQKPLVLMLGSKNGLKKLPFSLSADIFKTIKKIWPRPVTFVIKAPADFAKKLNSHNGTLAIRLADLPITKKIINEFGGWLATTSANLSGTPAAADFCQIPDQLLAGADYAIFSGRTRHQMPSTIIDLTKEKPEIIRSGAASEQILKILNSIR